MNRRFFLKAMGLRSIWMLGRGACAAMSAPASPAQKIRPPGTCMRWLDSDANGSCDHSEVKQKGCGRLTCPGLVKYAAREQAQKEGAV